MCRSFVAERWGYFRFFYLGDGRTRLALQRNAVKPGQDRALDWAWLLPTWSGDVGSWNPGKMAFGCLWKGGLAGQVDPGMMPRIA